MKTSTHTHTNEMCVWKRWETFTLCSSSTCHLFRAHVYRSRKAGGPPPSPSPRLIRERHQPSPREGDKFNRYCVILSFFLFSFGPLLLLCNGPNVNDPFHARSFWHALVSSRPIKTFGTFSALDCVRFLWSCFDGWERAAHHLLWIFKPTASAFLSRWIVDGSRTGQARPVVRLVDVEGHWEKEEEEEAKDDDETRHTTAQFITATKIPILRRPNAGAEQKAVGERRDTCRRWPLFFLSLSLSHRL